MCSASVEACTCSIQMKLGSDPKKVDCIDMANDFLYLEVTSTQNEIGSLAWQ
jgi:hypothetical protein